MRFSSRRSFRWCAPASAGRIHGTFETLEEVHLHHGDEDSLAALLGESAENLVLVGGADRLLAGRCAGSSSDDTARARSALISSSSCSKERKSPFQIDGGVNSLRRWPIGNPPSLSSRQRNSAAICLRERAMLRPSSSLKKSPPMAAMSSRVLRWPGGFLAQLVKWVCACREVSLTERMLSFSRMRRPRHRCEPRRRRR